MTIQKNVSLFSATNIIFKWHKYAYLYLGTPTGKNQGALIIYAPQKHACTLMHKKAGQINR